MAPFCLSFLLLLLNYTGKQNFYQVQKYKDFNFHFAERIQIYLITLYQTDCNNKRFYTIKIQKPLASNRFSCGFFEQYIYLTN